MRIDVVSIFPDYLAPLRLSLLGRARATGLVDLRTHDLRDWTRDRHRTVDDTPYGGGAGMVMRPEPWGEALDDLLASGEQPSDSVHVVIPSPSGTRFTQTVAQRLAGRTRLIFACGRYEGIDARVADHFSRRVPVEELSLGDFVLNGGEVAAMAMIEAVVRLLPGFVGNPESVVRESHAEEAGGLLEHPAYTKPLSWRGLEVPEVLRSGDHARIAAWRREQSEQRTRERRPDLLAQVPLTAGLPDTGVIPEAALPPTEVPAEDRLVLRPAVPADSGELLTLQRACWVAEAQANADPSIPPLVESLADVRRGLAEWTTWVVTGGPRLVGSVRARLEGEAWHIGRLMVAPDLQGRGLGRLLLSSAEERAPAVVRRYTIFTGAGSAANLSWYRRAGYRPLRSAGSASTEAVQGAAAGPAVVWLVKPRPGPSA